MKKISSAHLWYFRSFITKYMLILSWTVVSNLLKWSEKCKNSGHIQRWLCQTQSWTGGKHGLRKRRVQDRVVQPTPSTDARWEALPGSLRVNHTTTTTNFPVQMRNLDRFDYDNRMDPCSMHKGLFIYLDLCLYAPLAIFLACLQACWCTAASVWISLWTSATATVRHGGPSRHHLLYNME